MHSTTADTHQFCNNRLVAAFDSLDFLCARGISQLQRRIVEPWVQDGHGLNVSRHLNIVALSRCCAGPPSNERNLIELLQITLAAQHRLRLFLFAPPLHNRTGTLETRPSSTYIVNTVLCTGGLDRSNACLCRCRAYRSPSQGAANDFAGLGGRHKTHSSRW